MHQNRFRFLARADGPGLHWGSYDAPPDMRLGRRISPYHSPSPQCIRCFDVRSSFSNMITGNPTVITSARRNLCVFCFCRDDLNGLLTDSASSSRKMASLMSKLIKRRNNGASVSLTCCSAYDASDCTSYTHIQINGHEMPVTLFLSLIVAYSSGLQPCSQLNASVLEMLTSSTRRKDRCSMVSDPIQWL